MSRFEALLACFRSGQMSMAQLCEHMRDDAVFAAYVRKECGR